MRLPGNAAMKAIVLAVLSVFSFAATAEIYRWTDSDNKPHFSDRKPNNAKAESVHLQINSYTNVTYQLAPATPANNAAKAAKDVVMYSTA